MDLNEIKMAYEKYECINKMPNVCIHICLRKIVLYLQHNTRAKLQVV